MHTSIINHIKELFSGGNTALHEPKFMGNEEKYVMEAIKSNQVSSQGSFITKFELKFSEYIGSENKVVTTVNGTAALHLALKVSGIEEGDEVITQAMTFVATVNAISYCGAKAIFLDVSNKTLGLSSNSLQSFLENECTLIGNRCINKRTGKTIKAVIAMHTFGFPCEIEEIVEVAKKYHLLVIEDAAESVGSFYKGQHTGTFGDIGIFSFNGNKTITAGGGGAITSKHSEWLKKAKYLANTAKEQHTYEFIHNEIGYNYVMPNLNAALLLAQLENIDLFLANKRTLSEKYATFIERIEGVRYFQEPLNCFSNYWLNTIIFDNPVDRTLFLTESNKEGVSCRPVWKLMNHLPVYQSYQTDDLINSTYLEQRIVNLPSSVNI